MPVHVTSVSGVAGVAGAARPQAHSRQATTTLFSGQVSQGLGRVGARTGGVGVGGVIPVRPVAVGGVSGRTAQVHPLASTHGVKVLPLRRGVSAGGVARTVFAVPRAGGVRGRM